MKGIVIQWMTYKQTISYRLAHLSTRENVFLCCAQYISMGANIVDYSLDNKLAIFKTPD